jgi:hypothetical protein
VTCWRRRVTVWRCLSLSATMFANAGQDVGWAKLHIVENDSHLSKLKFWPIAVDSDCSGMVEDLSISMTSTGSRMLTYSREVLLCV